MFEGSRRHVSSGVWEFESFSFFFVGTRGWSLGFSFDTLGFLSFSMRARER